LHFLHYRPQITHRPDQVGLLGICEPTDRNSKRLKIMLYTLGSMGFSLEQIERGAHSAVRDVACLVDLQRCKDENPHAVHQHTSICYARGDWLTLEGKRTS